MASADAGTVKEGQRASACAEVASVLQHCRGRGPRLMQGPLGLGALVFWISPGQYVPGKHWLLANAALFCTVVCPPVVVFMVTVGAGLICCELPVGCCGLPGGGCAAAKGCWGLYKKSTESLCLTPPLPNLTVMTAYRALIRPSGEDATGRNCILDPHPGRWMPACRGRRFRARGQ